MDIGQHIPDLIFSVTEQDAVKEARLGDYQGHWLVLYFYPKDATPGCTIEARDFRDAYTQFQALNTIILGVSRDSISSHHQFKRKCGLPFELISDEKEALCDLFDVIKIKSMYGKKLRGIERSTFLIDDKGVLRKVWRRVKVIGHVEDVLEAIQNLNQKPSG